MHKVSTEEKQGQVADSERLWVMQDWCWGWEVQWVDKGKGKRWGDKAKL